MILLQYIITTDGVFFKPLFVSAPVYDIIVQTNKPSFMSKRVKSIANIFINLSHSLYWHHCTFSIFDIKYLQTGLWPAFSTMKNVK